jgi:hypothetical protein
VGERGANQSRKGQSTDLDGFDLNVSLENRPTVCILPKPSRRDPGDPLKMKAKVALIREARAQRNLGQAELAICPQEVLCSFNPACDYKLVRRESGSSFKLPRKMIDAEVNNCRHSFQTEGPPFRKDLK